MRFTRTAPLAVAFSALAFATSSAGAQQPAAPRVHDSAGVRIVEHPTIKTATIAFTIAANPTLDLGGVKNDPQDEFDPGSPFLSGKRLSDGRIVTTNNSSLKMFDAKGHFVRTIGRKGSGPGEFNQTMDVCVTRGDTIVAIQMSLPFMTVFDSAGKHVRTVTADGIAGADPCFTDGSVLFKTRTGPNPATRLPSDKAATLDRVATMVRFSRSGGPAKKAGDFPDGNSAMAYRMNGTIAVRRDTLYAGDGQSATVCVYSASGALIRAIRWSDTRTAITDDMFRRNLTVAPATRGNAPDVIASFEERLRTAPRPEFVPVFRYLKADAAGRIWVEDYPTKWSDPTAWTVFAGNGDLLGRVSLPAIADMDTRRQPELMDIGRDFVVIRWFDQSDGAQHLSFHALQPAQR